MKLVADTNVLVSALLTPAGAILVTGNTRYFPARARAGVKVLTPAEFLDLLRRRS